MRCGTGLVGKAFTRGEYLTDLLLLTYHYMRGVAFGRSRPKRQERVEALSATCSVPLLRAANSPTKSFNWFIEPEHFYFSRLPPPVGYFLSPPFPLHPEIRQKFDDETLELALEHHNRASFRSGGLPARRNLAPDTWAFYLRSRSTSCFRPLAVQISY